MHIPDKEFLRHFGGVQESEETERPMYNGSLKNVRFMKEGAGYVGMPDKEDWRTLFNHICLDYNLSLHIADQLRQAVQRPEVQAKLRETGKEDLLKDIVALDMDKVAKASLVHDIGKRRGEEQWARKGETGAIDDQHHLVGYRMATQEMSQPKDIARVPLTHYFPTSGNALRLLDKIVILSDGMTAQKYLTVDGRIADLRQRWIRDRLAKGQKPQIDPDRFEKYATVLEQVSAELFGILDVSDQQAFINAVPQREEEKILRRLFEEATPENFTILLDQIESTRTAAKVVLSGQ